jgi:hypothetical protein
MHFIAAWNIATSGPEWNSINTELATVLKPYSWARPLPTLYVVNVPSQETWQKILGELTTVAQKYPQNVQMILSPIMQGGHYNGYLKKDMWEEINKRSN